ncbi:MAG: PQQ-binding-like beta-propeller repeat protein [Calothrix sp. FI2-JRJ7]|nr:PQQ-binding-like beta-propeller repeat protein [Calothrix sp. FI2-JRJ7]
MQLHFCFNPHAVFAVPTVVNGHLYVGAWDKKLHAFGL